MRKLKCDYCGGQATFTEDGDGTIHVWAHQANTRAGFPQSTCYNYMTRPNGVNAANDLPIYSKVAQ